jgi:Ring finger domain
MEAANCENMERKDDAATDASTIVVDSSVSRLILSIPECAICMESYNLGDSIVWSSNPDCHHVFHTACIYEWLRREIEVQWKCPYCRQPFAVSSGKTLITESITTASTI